MQGAQRQQQDSGETFRFEASRALPQHLFLDWFNTAPPGDRIAYCEGYIALREDASWKLAGAWAREGLVHLVTEKDGSRNRWLAEKIGGASLRPTGSLRGPDGSLLEAGKANPTLGRIAEMQAEVLFKLLRDAALAGERCPTKTAMALAVTGLDDQRARNRVTYLRKRLEAEGRIAWAAGSHAQAPVVTILARGKGCGLSTRADQTEGE